MECLRCGRCCQYLAMKVMGMSPEVIDYLVIHGCEHDDGYLLIPHRCQHLKIDPKASEWMIEEDGTKWIKTKKYMCDIHNTDVYPVLCKRFHGHGRYYIPQGCAYVDPTQEKEERKNFEAAISKSLKRRERANELRNRDGLPGAI